MTDPTLWISEQKVMKKLHHVQRNDSLGHDAQTPAETASLLAMRVRAAFFERITRPCMSTFVDSNRIDSGICRPKCGFIRKQTHRTTCMQKHNVVGGLEMALANQVDETRHALACVDRVKKQPFGSSQ